MKAGLSLARPTKTTGTALLQKTVPHGARCPRIEPCPTQRADGRAAPPARRSGPERAAQARPSGSRPGTFGPLTHRCERKPIQRPIRKKQALAPAFTPALSGRQPAGDAFAGGETERGAVSGLFFAPFHTAFPSVRSDREARRESPVGPDRGMPIKYRPFRSIRRPGSENRMFLPLTHYSDSGRISGVVFSYSPRTQRSPHRRTAPSENRTARAPPPRPISDTDKALTPFLRSKDTTKPEHARLRTPPQAPGPFPDSGFSPLVMPATCSAPLPVAAHRTQGLSILPGDFSDTGRLPPARPVPRRKGTEKSVAPRPIRGGGNRTGNRRTGRGPCAPEPMFSGTERLDFPEKILILHNYDFVFVSSCRFVCITK